MAASLNSGISPSGCRISSRNSSAFAALSRMRSRLGHPCLETARRQDVDDIHEILGDDAVIERTALEMPAIGEDLFPDFPGQDLAAQVEPSVGLFSREKHAGEDQGDRVLEIVVGQDMIFDVAFQPRRLAVKARDPCVFRRPRALGPQDIVDPVHDPQRNRVRLPRVGRAGWIAGDPVVDEVVARVDRPRLVEQVIEVMQVVAPEPRDVRAMPVDGVPAERPRRAEEYEIEVPRSPFACTGTRPKADPGSALDGRRRVDPRRGPLQRPPVYEESGLLDPEIANRSKKTTDVHADRRSQVF